MYSIDRIEGDYAVLEQDGVLTNVPLSELPEGVREGDLLVPTQDGWAECPAAAEEHRRRIVSRRRRLLGNAT